MPASSPGGPQALDAVLSRAATDAAFRQELLREPRAAIRDAFGVQIPDDFRIRFVERDPDLDALVVLPDFREEPEDSVLSEEELEMVSGGGGAHLAWSRAVKPIRRPPSV